VTAFRAPPAAFIENQRWGYACRSEGRESLDAGSIPATSTNFVENLDRRFLSQTNKVNDLGTAVFSFSSISRQSWAPVGTGREPQVHTLLQRGLARLLRCESVWAMERWCWQYRHA